MDSTKTLMRNSDGSITVWHTVRSCEGFEPCTQAESIASNNGEPIRFLNWNTGLHTFHRSDRSTSGRQVKRGPDTVWLRKR